MLRLKELRGLVYLLLLYMIQASAVAEVTYNPDNQMVSVIAAENNVYEKFRLIDGKTKLPNFKAADEIFSRLTNEKDKKQLMEFLLRASPKPTEEEILRLGLKTFVKTYESFNYNLSYKPRCEQSNITSNQESDKSLLDVVGNNHCVLCQLMAPKNPNDPKSEIVPMGVVVGSLDSENLASSNDKNLENPISPWGIIGDSSTFLKPEYSLTYSGMNDQLFHGVLRAVTRADKGTNDFSGFTYGSKLELGRDDLKGNTIMATVENGLYVNNSTSVLAPQNLQTSNLIYRCDNYQDGVYRGEMLSSHYNKTWSDYTYDMKSKELIKSTVQSKNCKVVQSAHDYFKATIGLKKDFASNRESQPKNYGIISASFENESANGGGLPSFLDPIANRALWHEAFDSAPLSYNNDFKTRKSYQLELGLGQKDKKMSKLLGYCYDVSALVSKSSTGRAALNVKGSVEVDTGTLFNRSVDNPLFAVVFDFSKYAILKNGSKLRLTDENQKFANIYAKYFPSRSDIASGVKGVKDNSETKLGIGVKMNYDRDLVFYVGGYLDNNAANTEKKDVIYKFYGGYTWK